MNRWHQVSCDEPDVEVLLDKTIRCRSCHQTPHATELVAEKTSASSVPQVPPNKPLGQLNLWWPRSVPYSTSKLPVGGGSNEGQDDGHAGHGSEAANTTPYYSSLRPNEFRLICIEATDSPDYLLHLTLEVYDLDNCPEYEAVSYTWAGEDGDSTLCKPIYAGPFWDRLLQTKNCWEMLRFVRPWRGIRMVWVDAICINQTDILERSSQVANMGRIYSLCSRVIVYLGPDIVTSLNGLHARRGRLHELETGAITPVLPTGGQHPQPYRLKDLLSRRYFSRIWVVQELLLSQRAIVRVGDVDFWADGVMSTRLSSSLPNWNWGRMPAAWVRYISQGPSSVKDLKELLCITSLSLATDPRDRVFGLLGIMPELADLKNPPTSDSNPSLQLGGLQADYSLPYQHVFIGLFGYCLLNLRQPNILYHASCLWRVSDYPSWAPNWTSPTTWRLLFQSPKATSEQIINFVQGKTDFTPGYRQGSRQLHDLVGPANPDVQNERRWNQNASISTSTGALSINLTHYMPLDKRLEQIGDAQVFSIFALRSGPFAAYLVSEQRLDQLITGSGNEQLFILDIDESSRMYLLLRPTSHLNRFRLVAVCPYVVIQTPWTSESGIRLKDLQHSLHDMFPYAHRALTRQSFLFTELADISYGLHSFRDLLPTLVELYTEGETDGTKITNAVYAACRKFIHSRYSPRIGEEGHIEVTISSLWEQFSTYVTKNPGWLRIPESSYRYRIKGERDWKIACVSPTTYKSLTQKEHWVEIRFGRVGERWDLRREAKWDFGALFSAMDNFSRTGKYTGEDLLSMLTIGPRNEDKFVGCPGPGYGQLYSFRELWDKLQLVGSTYMVHIE